MREVAHLPISPYISLYLRTSPYVSQVEYMKEVAKNAAEDLSLEERNLLSVAYKNVVGARRGSPNPNPNRNPSPSPHPDPSPSLNPHPNPHPD